MTVDRPRDGHSFGGRSGCRVVIVDVEPGNQSRYRGTDGQVAHLTLQLGRDEPLAIDG